MADQPLKLNLTLEEASSEARSFKALPTGDYHVKITDIELQECGPNSKNPGKPYWHITHVVQEGDYENSHLWTNAMLFEGALYTLVQLLKATGHFDGAGSALTVPDPDSLIGRDVIVNVQRKKDGWAMKDASPNDPPIFKNEIKGYKTFEEGAVAAAAGKAKKNSLLP